jgi:hypothetical protein
MGGTTLLRYSYFTTLLLYSYFTTAEDGDEARNPYGWDKSWWTASAWFLCEYLYESSSKVVK